MNPNLLVLDQTMSRFTRIPSYLEQFITKRKITYKDAMVYAKLLSYVNTNSGECFPSQRKIAESFGVDKKSIQRSIKRLEAASLLDHHNDGILTSNHYFILDPKTALDKLNRADNAHSNDPFLQASRCPHVEVKVSPPWGQAVAIPNLSIESNDSSLSTANANLEKIKNQFSNLLSSLSSKDERGCAPLPPQVTEAIYQSMSLIFLLIERTPLTPLDDAQALDADALDAYRQYKDDIEIEKRSKTAHTESELENDVEIPKDEKTPALCGANCEIEGNAEVIMFSKEMQTKGLKQKTKDKLGKKVGLTEKRATQVFDVYGRYLKACKELGYVAASEPTRKQAAKISELVKKISDIQLIGQVTEFAVKNWKEMSHAALPADMASRCGTAPVLEILFTQSLFENWMRLEKNPEQAKKKKMKRHVEKSNHSDSKFQQVFSAEGVEVEEFDPERVQYKSPAKEKKGDFDY